MLREFSWNICERYAVFSLVCLSLWKRLDGVDAGQQSQEILAPITARKMSLPVRINRFYERLASTTSTLRRVCAYTKMHAPRLHTSTKNSGQPLAIHTSDPLWTKV
ncbi:hypothetical protein F5I97DRAFT_1905653 [Phlebopus sp. FC_14]|nr:hypothetical protein F5I97DRAFT_1905653 [Phlebopus sp. FC_14]